MPGDSQFTIDPALRDQWTQFKTEQLDVFIQKLIETVKTYRPHVKTARNIYSEPVEKPYAQEWFSQDFERFLDAYDHTVIMAYSRMEGIPSFSKTKKWFARLIDRAEQHQALDRVIFKLQAYDWAEKEWISEKELKKQFRFLVSRGVWHTAYYPDTVFENRPDTDKLSSIMSARYLPAAWRLKQ